jgi:uncharacterized protein (TIGR03435 family)
MTVSRYRTFTSNFILTLAAILQVGAIPCISAQTTQPPESATPSGKPSPLPAAYDVVSVKPHKADDPAVGSRWRTAPTGFSANVSVRSLIMSAYNLIMLDQISGLPDWAERENFDVEGKLDADTAEVFGKLSRSDQTRQRQLMMQDLLADRFRLRVRLETKDLPVYNLVVAKNGLKMKESPPSENSGYSMGMDSMGMGRINSKAMEVAALVASLSNPVGRKIIDKTSLTGKYEVNLTWAWNDEPGSGDNGPSIFTALQEQLGLKLESARAPIDVVVIDHIERPSEN